MAYLTIIITRAASSDIVECEDKYSKVPLEYMTHETPISAVLPVALEKLHTYDQVCLCIASINVSVMII